MTKTSLILALMLMLSGCTTSYEEAFEALENAGFTEIKPGNLSIMGCGEDDKVGRTFSAKNPHGKTVSGVVCCGVWKGCTVRF